MLAGNLLLTGNFPIVGAGVGVSGAGADWDWGGFREREGEERGDKNYQILISNHFTEKC